MQFNIQKNGYSPEQVNKYILELSDQLSTCQEELKKNKAEALQITEIIAAAEAMKKKYLVDAETEATEIVAAAHNEAQKIYHDKIYIHEENLSALLALLSAMQKRRDLVEEELQKTVDDIEAQFQKIATLLNNSVESIKAVLNGAHDVLRPVHENTPIVITLPESNSDVVASNPEDIFAMFANSEEMEREINEVGGVVFEYASEENQATTGQE